MTGQGQAHSSWKNLGVAALTEGPGGGDWGGGPEGGHPRQRTLREHRVGAVAPGGPWPPVAGGRGSALLRVSLLELGEIKPGL